MAAETGRRLDGFLTPPVARTRGDRSWTAPEGRPDRSWGHGRAGRSVWTDTCDAGRPGGRTVTHPSVDDSQRRAVAGSDARLEAIAVVVSARAAVARELPLLLAISSHADAL